MGSVYHEDIERAGKYLLSLLRQYGQVQYLELYDGSDEAHQRLLQNIGADEREHPELLMDLAAYQLEEMGIVERVELDERLVDGEPDYLVMLTDDGRMLLEDGFVPTYENMEL